jgi:hypothetical protein
LIDKVIFSKRLRGQFEHFSLKAENPTKRIIIHLTLAAGIAANRCSGVEPRKIVKAAATPLAPARLVLWIVAELR